MLPCPSLLSLKLILLHSIRHLQELLLLLHVRSLQTCSHGCAWVATSVHDMLVVVVLSLVEQRLDTRLRKCPSTSVQRLLLSPDNGLGIGVAVEILLELLPWERVELLDTGDGHIINLVVGAVLVQRGVNLAGANDDSINFLTCLDVTTLMRWILDDPLELRIANKVLNVGASKGVTQKGLGEEDDQGCDWLVIGV